MFKYSISALPGERELQSFYDHTEDELQALSRQFQEWRMNIGLDMENIDQIVDGFMQESFGSFHNIECDKEDVFALIELKHFHIKSDGMVKALYGNSGSQKVAKKASLPYFVVKYFPREECGHWEFHVYPVCPLAKAFLSAPAQMSEADYIRFLNQLRGITYPEEILTKLRDNVKTHKLEIY